MSAEVTADLYRGKGSTYFSAARLDLLAMLPSGGGLRILEVGAGNGATLKAAKTLGIASYVAGIDLVDSAPPSDPLAGVDVFLPGNVESMALDLPVESFDVILCGDVLEHLVDPWRAVRLLTVFLKPGGLFVSSIPNFRNHRVLRLILSSGDFRYSDGGILDLSHLRFFCKKNIRSLFEQAGLRVESIETNMGAYGIRHRVLDYLTLCILREFFVFQYRTRAIKPGPPLPSITQ